MVVAPASSPASRSSLRNVMIAFSISTGIRVGLL